MTSEPENLFPTFEKFQQKPGNETKSFNDYLITYFKARAIPYVRVALSGQLGQLSRITEDLATIHPRLSNKDIIQQYMLAVADLENEKKLIEHAKLAKNPNQEKIKRSEMQLPLILKRWFYASVNIMSHLFLDQSGKIKEMYLKELIDDKFKNLQEVTAVLYGDPETQDKIKRVADQIVGSAALAVIQILVADQEIIDNPIFNARSFGLPSDNINLRNFNKTINYDALKNFLMVDPLLGRIERVRMQKNFLQALNKLLPPEKQINDLDEVLNDLFDKLVLASPNVDSELFDMIYNTYLNRIIHYTQDIGAKEPKLLEILNQFEEISIASLEFSKDGEQACIDKLNTGNVQIKSLLEDAAIALRQTTDKSANP